MLEQDIEKARETVSRKKKEYDKAVEALSRLLDEQKRQDAGKNITLDAWTFKWNGEAVWDAGSGTVDCEYEATVVFKPCRDIRGPEVKKLQIEQNDFTPEDLYLVLEKSLRDMLDSEFEDYCSDDDYYQPVVEDFEAEEYIKDWAEKRGLEVVSFDGDGDDRGFEPKGRRW